LLNSITPCVFANVSLLHELFIHLFKPSSMTNAKWTVIALKCIAYMAMAETVAASDLSLNENNGHIVINWSLGFSSCHNKAGCKLPQPYLVTTITAGSLQHMVQISGEYKSIIK
jgi:hypothetical protein